MFRTSALALMLAAVTLTAMPAAAFSFNLPYLTYPETPSDAAGSTGR